MPATGAHEYLKRQRRKELFNRLEKDDVLFFEKCLKIITKDGEVVPFTLNRAQLYAHEQIEKQKRETGKVRAIIIKGRQQGFSTWIAARFFKQTIYNSHQSTFIVSHRDDTTNLLFDKVDFYHKNLPSYLIPPKKVEDNKQFMRLDNGSQYSVGTAGAGDVGRGSTNQRLHLSEAAFYQNPDRIAAGVMNSVADNPGTEIIIETTVNGIGNWFHNLVKQSLEGKSDYIVIFVPWFWQPEYRAPVPYGFTLTPEEEELKEIYGLDDEQIQWRRNKKATYEEEEKFRMEYPNSLEEAFMASAKSLYRQIKIEAACKRAITVKEPTPIICGVDCSGTGGDPTAILRRQGAKVLDYEKIPGVSDPMELLGTLIRRIEDELVDMYFLDYAYAYGLISRARELGYSEYFHGVYFSETKSMMKPETYLNKRAEMYALSRDWFDDHVQFPDNSDLKTQLLSIPNFIPTSNGKFKLEEKRKIKEQNKVELDLADAFALTFAMPFTEVRRKSILAKLPQGIGIQNKIAKAGKPLLKSKERMKRR